MLSEPAREDLFDHHHRLHHSGVEHDGAARDADDFALDARKRTARGDADQIGAGPRAATGEGLAAPESHDLGRRIDTIRYVLETGSIVDELDVAVIGRRVTWREPDGSTVTASLVIPGDGDPRQGWISVDSPLGAALVGAAPGDHVTVHAPAGDRLVTVEAVS